MIHSITAKAIRLLPVMYPILLLLLSVHAPLASCIDQQKQEATNNISIPQPRYFSKLPQERINLEVEYAQTHRKWSQRVVLEIFHSQMIGRSAVFNGNASMEGADIGTFRHPETGEFEKFRKGQQPNWDHFNYEGMDTICNHWEGITCHEREDNGIGDICWCIMEWEANEYKWADDSDNVPADCQRKCQGHDMIGKNQAPLDAITRINLNNYGLVGSMIPEELSHLKFLERIELGGNRLIGAFPRTLGDLPGLKHVNLSNCDVLEFSKDLKPMLWLDELILRDSYLSGTIPQGLFHSTKLILLDLGKNELNGSIPSEFFHLTKLVKVLLDDNMLTGTIPTEIGRLASLKYFSMEYNELTGSIPHEMATLPHLEFLKLNHNDLTGKIPPELFTDSFLALEVYNNQLTGSIPKEMQASTSLQFVNLARNKLKGKIEPEFCERIRPVSKFSNDDVSPCDHLIVCPRGYFHYLGLATLTEGCASCPSCHSGDLKDKSCSYVGQTTCNDGTTIVRGDMDGDGALSEREILRLIYMLNEGHDWEDEFSVWGDMTHGDACDLPGVDCKSGLMGISLKKANMCSSRNKSCGVLPLEIGLLQKSLEVLDVGRTSENKTRMRIPSEIGQLTKLKVLDVSNNLIGALPSEIGQCQELLLLNLFRTGLTGTLEENVWSLKKLQKLDIRENKFSSQNISQIMQLANLQEILASRSSLVGTIPSEIGALKGLMNIELWGNALVGSIPQSVEKLQFLTRIDLYTNHLTGSIEPLATLPSIEIIHLKKNNLSGTIPSSLGEIAKKLSWLDLSGNHIVGEIPSSLGSLQHLADFQVGDNKLFSPIPESLCSSEKVNGGQVGDSCDHILCPMGTFSEHGFAKSGGAECIPCLEGKETMFLGQTSCSKPIIGDYIELFYSTIYNLDWVRSDEDEFFFDGGNECEWEGVTCDKDHNVNSIEFSLSKLEFDEDLFRGHGAISS